jgi:hypothetical protein
MDTLFAIGMLVGLLKSHAAEPPKAAAPVEQHEAATVKPRPRYKPAPSLGY